MIRVFFIVLLALGTVQCQTVPKEPKKELPFCDPNKVYPAVHPPVCRPVEKLKCPKTKRLGLPYTPVDEANYQVALKRCPEKFPVSPCLKVFAKIEAYTYRAICGAEDAIGKQEFLDWKDRSR